MPMNRIIPAAVLPTMVLGLTIYFSYGILLRTCFVRLRRRHLDVWKALGQPLGSDGNGRVVWAARKYLMSEECRSLGDPVLYKRAHLAYVLGLVGSTLFALAIVVGLA